MKIFRVMLCLLFGSEMFLTPGAGASEEDFREAMKRAEKGDSEAQLSVGMMYSFGEGVPQNFEEALKWYRRAAVAGNPIAQNNLGTMYLSGRGVPKNAAEGSRWLRLAADQGYSQAEMNLGAVYADGVGGVRNPAEAVRWFRKAAEQGDPEAERNLGAIYANGELVRADYVEAYKWLNLAAARGNDVATQQRDELAKKMSPQQIAEAQRLSAAFVARKDPATANTPRATGTGFFVTRDGYVMTAYHVVENASRVVVKTRFVALAAQVAKVDKDNDLALLKVLGAYPSTSLTNGATYQITNVRLAAVAPNFRPLSVADSAAVKLGDAVSTLGFPNPQLQGSAPKFTRGEINSLTGIKDDPNYFQVSAPIQPGNSGGPLLDRSGNVIGIIQLTLNDLTQLLRTGNVPQNVNYALKSDHLLSFLRSVPGVNATVPPPGVEAQTKDWISDAQTSVAVIIVY
jgi:uncharacterized protein